MLNRLNTLWQFMPLGCKRAALATSLLASLSASVACAQSGGVVFVDDLEQQAMQTSRTGMSPSANQLPGSRSRGPYAVTSRAPAPSAQSRFPQPTMQSYARPKVPQEKPSWTAGLKKTVGGWFGNDENKSNPQAKNPAARKTNSRKRSFAATRPDNGKPKKLDNQQTRIASTTPSATPRAGTRSGGIQQRPTNAGSTPRGLLQLWGNKADNKQPIAKQSAPPSGRRMAQNQAKPQRQPSGNASWASKLMSPLAGKEQPKTAALRSAPPVSRTPASRNPRSRDDMVAMVTDQQPLDSGKQSQSKVRLASDQGTLATMISDSKLPEIVGPVTSTDSANNDRSTSSTASRVSRAMSRTLPAQVATTNPTMPRGQFRPTQSRPTTSGPKEIVNRHASATKIRTAAMATTKQPNDNWKAKAIANQAANRASNVASKASSQDHGVSMPANPVVHREPAAIQPSEKAVQLLTEANRLSTTAVSEDEYTTVLQICRHVLAIDEAPAAVSYSHDLASWALNRRGELKSDQGRAKEALLDFEDALRLDPKRWRAIHNRGVLAAQAGRFADAFDDFNRALELNPKFAKAYSNRGALYVQAGKLAKASDDYRQAIALDPDLAVAHKGRGRVCHMLGQFDLSLQHFDAATMLAPDDSRIVNNRGDLLSDMGRYRAAMGDYQKAIELDSSLAVAYRNLAWIQATCPDKECRDASEASANAGRAMQLCGEPGDLEYDTLAAAQAAAGDFETAIATMAKAIDLATEADKPNYQWRKQLYEQGEPYITEPASNIQKASYAN